MPSCKPPSCRSCCAKWTHIFVCAPRQRTPHSATGHDRLAAMPESASEPPYRVVCGQMWLMVILYPPPPPKLIAPAPGQVRLSVRHRCDVVTTPNLPCQPLRQLDMYARTHEAVAGAWARMCAASASIGAHAQPGMHSRDRLPTCADKLEVQEARGQAQPVKTHHAAPAATGRLGPQWRVEQARTHGVPHGLSTRRADWHHAASATAPAGGDPSSGEPAGHRMFKYTHQLQILLHVLYCGSTVVPVVWARSPCGDALRTDASGRLAGRSPAGRPSWGAIDV